MLVGSFLLCFMSSLFGKKNVVPLVSHVGICSGIWMTSVRDAAKLSCISVKQVI